MIHQAKRMPGDPIGMRGLPNTRFTLDAMVDNLRDRLAAAGGPVRGQRLVADMGLQDTRALRLLVAYARIHHREHRVVGCPGEGYVWGGENVRLYRAAGDKALRYGRCYLFLTSLYRRQGTATAIAQMALDAVGHGPAGSLTKKPDDLAALVAAEGVGVGDVLDALIAELMRTGEGQEALRHAGRKHADVLMPRAVVEEIVAGLDEIKERFLAGVRTAG